MNEQTIEDINSLTIGRMRIRKYQHCSSLWKYEEQDKEGYCRSFPYPRRQVVPYKAHVFSRLNMSQPQTMHDEYWHPHVDKVSTY